VFGINLDVKCFYTALDGNDVKTLLKVKNGNLVSTLEKIIRRFFLTDLHNTILLQELSQSDRELV